MKEAPETVAAAEFSCSLCGKLAGRIELTRDSERTEVRRVSFSSEMGARPPAETCERVRAAIEARDMRELFAIDLEYTPFYCPRCDLCYCGEHWKWQAFYEGCFYDCIRGHCPKGHYRMLED